MTSPAAWRRRLALLVTVGLVFLGLLLQRLYQLQIVEGAVHRHRAFQNAVLVQPIPAPRGRILDDRGRVLASNQPRFEVTLTPVEVRDLSRTVRLLSRVLPRDAAALQRLVLRRQKVAPADPVVLAHALKSDQVARLAELAPQLPGVQLQIRPLRRYPYGELASHVLGYVGDITADQYARWHRAGYHGTDIVGQSGLEASYETALRGRGGTQDAYVDPRGYFTQVVPGTNPLAGADLHLSLDVGLQTFAEETLQKTLDRLSADNGETTAGAIVMLEVRTGRVLCMASRPNFDPRLFAGGISDRDYQHLMTNPLRPLLSRAYQASYPPGSTFKVINASASLQSRVCTPQSVFFCNGLYRGFHCFVRSGHGRLTFTEAIAQSCDATFYRLGDLLGIGRLARFAHAFGLGSRTGLDLPDEQSGLLATPAWKRRVYHEDWQYYDTINMAIGQGMLNVTPLQMAVAVAAVANGGYVYPPHLVDYVESSNHHVLWRYHPRPLRRVPVEPRFLSAVRIGMAAVVDHGTGAGARSSLITLGGKTGTAEAVPTVDNPHGRNHTWFDCYAPTDKPEIATVVLVVKAGGYGGGVCAPMARDCVEYWVQHVRRGARP